MLRSLPPSGHPIRLGSILDALTPSRGDARALTACADYPRSSFTVSGTAAITVALMALRTMRDRDSVIVPAYTCPSVVTAVLRAGLRPILCDLEADSFRMRLDALQDAIDTSTLAVVAVHLMGIPENLSRIREVASSRGAFVVEDATQAYGNWIGGDSPRMLGSLGDVGAFSFGRGKPLTFMAGGAIVASDGEISEAVRRVGETLDRRWRRGFFPRYLAVLLAYWALFHPRMYWIPSSIPALGLGETRFSPDVDLHGIHPAVIRLGNAVAPGFPEIRATRLRVSRRYHDELADADCDVTLPSGRPDDEVALLRFPVLMKSKNRRDHALRILAGRGLGATPMYRTPLSEIDGLQGRFPGEVHPNASSVADRLLTLPLHGHVRNRDVRLACSVLREESDG